MKLGKSKFNNSGWRRQKLTFSSGKNNRQMLNKKKIEENITNQLDLVDIERTLQPIAPQCTRI